MFFEFLYVVFNIILQIAFIHWLCQKCLIFKKKKLQFWVQLMVPHVYIYIYIQAWGCCIFNSFWFKKNISIFTTCNSSDPIGQLCFKKQRLAGKKSQFCSILL